MADKKPEKKGDKKPAPAPGMSPYAFIAIIFGGLFVLSQLFSLISKWLVLDMSKGGIFNPDVTEAINRFFVALISSLQAVAAFISLLFIIGIMYAKFRMGQIKRELKLKEKMAEVKEKQNQQDEETENKKWKRVVEHVSSVNSSDWRLSILEADILLADMLEREGFVGETVADKLKSANIATFKTLDEAWEAHKVRNSLAHEGSDFALSQREAKRVISLFEDVFREFHFI